MEFASGLNLGEKMGEYYHHLENDPWITLRKDILEGVYVSNPYRTLFK